MKPLVSCIIPVWNSERFIGEAIGSVLAQTYSPIELIVVDDGSTDNTAQVVYDAFPDALYVRQENAGSVVARNNGLTRASGEFIAFLDSDDRWLAHKIERQLAEFTLHPELGCVISRVRLFWEALAAEEAAYRHDNREEVVGCANSTMLVLHSAFRAVGNFRADLPHTAAPEWFGRFNDAGYVMGTVQEVLVERRMHVDNFSRRQRAVKHDEFLHLVKRSMDRKRGQSPSA